MLRVEKIGTRRHFYLVSTGVLDASHLEAHCAECGSIYAHELDFWVMYEDWGDLTFKSMMKTCPWLMEWLEEREDVEIRIANRQESHAERMGLLYEAVVNLEYMASIKTTTGTYESITSIVAFVFIFTSFGTAITMFGGVHHPYGYLWPIFGGVSFVVLLSRTLSATRSHSCKAVIDNIAKSMTPYKPSHSEIEQLKVDHPESKLLSTLKSRVLLDRIDKYTMDDPRRLVSSTHPH